MPSINGTGWFIGHPSSQQTDKEIHKKNETIDKQEVLSLNAQCIYTDFKLHIVL